jgi:ABC-type lipoprotein release transport system permease subunit
MEKDRVQRQISLPWKKAFEISMLNVRLRLGRAAITAAGILLGIAFLMSVFVSTQAQAALQREHDQEIQKAIQQGTADTKTMGSNTRQKASDQARVIWLVVMSLLVSGVGITNSMLMSVTERFREIGTMKCLGALDQFIVRLYLIESSLLGMLGSVAGALLGGSVMLLVWCLKEGFSLTSKLNWGTLGLNFAMALVIGTVVTLLAAIPPSVRAAKMPPAAALRTEI